MAWFGCFQVSHRETVVSLTAGERPGGEQLGEEVSSVLDITSKRFIRPADRGVFFKGTF